MNQIAADADLVVAAREGSQDALEELVARYLPLVYNIVGRALNGQADVDDVVQETMLNVVRGLPGLQDQQAFRSWLVAVTMNQIRRHYRNRPQQQWHPLDDLAVVADPGADFADLTLTELGLSGQRRETVEATRWLDEDNRELLSLWWLVNTGHLTRTELVDAIGLDSHHVTVRVSRMKTQLDTARLVVRALTAVPRCADLTWVMSPWDGRPSALWRKRLARHVHECAHCEGLGTDLVPVERLLVNLALVPLPVGYGAYLLTSTSSPTLQVTSASARGPHTRHGAHRRLGAAKHRASRTLFSGKGSGRSLATLGSKPLLAAAALTATVTAALGAGSLGGANDGTSAGHQPGGLAVADDSAAAPASTPKEAPARTQHTPTPKATPSKKPPARHAAPSSGPQHTAPAHTPAPAKPTPSAPTAHPSAPSTEQAAALEVLNVINQARAEQNLTPLQLSSGLGRSSAQHTHTMAAGCGLQHQCPGEPSPSDRETAAGVQWGAAGENIGDGGPVADAQQNVTGMAVGFTKGMLAEQPPNDGHRRNILSPDFHHIGITVLRDSKGVVWMTQDFSD